MLTALHSPDGPPHLSSRTPSFILQVGGSPSSCGVAVFSNSATRLIQQDVISPTSTLHPLTVQPHLSNNAASPCLQVPPHSPTVQPRLSSSTTSFLLPAQLHSLIAQPHPILPLQPEPARSLEKEEGKGEGERREVPPFPVPCLQRAASHYDYVQSPKPQKGPKTLSSRLLGPASTSPLPHLLF